MWLIGSFVDKHLHRHDEIMTIIKVRICQQNLLGNHCFIVWLFSYFMVTSYTIYITISMVWTVIDCKKPYKHNRDINSFQPTHIKSADQSGISIL